MYELPAEAAETGLTNNTKANALISNRKTKRLDSTFLDIVQTGERFALFTIAGVWLLVNKE
jgi:hypothetical protein